MVVPKMFFNTIESGNMARKQDTRRRSKINFDNHGILRLVSAKYPTLMEAVWEVDSNGIDAVPEIADRPQMDRLGKVYKPRVDIRWNKKTRDILIRDNGGGISISHYEECLQHIGRSDNQGNPDKLGEFGLGFMSPFGKCRAVTFMSAPQDGSNTPWRWEFDTQDLLNQQGGLSVPGGPYVQQPHEWWNSEVHIMDYTKDKQLSSMELERFCEHLLNAYNTHLKRKKTYVEVTVIDDNGAESSKTVKPLKSLGSRLQEITYTDVACGTTRFELFLAKGVGGSKPKGKVIFRSHTGYGLAAKTKSLNGLMDTALLKALQSGVFEGDICFDALVKLEPSRRWFDADDALCAAVDHVERWVKKHGLQHTGQKTQPDRVRWTQTGNLVMKVMQQAMKSLSGLDEFKGLTTGIEFGSIGDQHAKTGAKKGGQFPAKSVDGSGSKTRDPNAPPRPVRNPNPKARSGHTPGGTVGGNGGQVRQQVKKDSLGFWLDWGQVVSGDLWELDMTSGKVLCNVYHPVWTELDRTQASNGSQIRTEKQREKAISDLQMRIMAQVYVTVSVQRELEGVYGTKPSVTRADCDWALRETRARIMKFEAFLISEADRITNQGGFVDRRPKAVRAKSRKGA